MLGSLCIAGRNCLIRIGHYNSTKPFCNCKKAFFMTSKTEYIKIPGKYHEPNEERKITYQFKLSANCMLLYVYVMVSTLADFVMHISDQAYRAFLRTRKALFLPIADKNERKYIQKHCKNHFVENSRNSRYHIDFLVNYWRHYLGHVDRWS